MGPEETQFVKRMERLLQHGSVKSVMAHAQSPSYLDAWELPVSGKRGRNFEDRIVFMR